MLLVSIFSSLTVFIDLEVWKIGKSALLGCGRLDSCIAFGQGDAADHIYSQHLQVSLHIASLLST